MLLNTEDKLVKITDKSMSLKNWQASVLLAEIFTEERIQHKGWNLVIPKWV